MTNQLASVTDVFKTTGIPDVTYVERTNRGYEDQLRLAIEASGKLCLITGPSKTGKTTLFRRVTQKLNLTAIVIRCNSSMHPTDIWKSVLEALEYDRSTKKNKGSKNSFGTEGELSGGLGWKWIAKLTGKISASAETSLTDEECRERVLAEPNIAHVIPVLKEQNVLLVIEDFHYLSYECQRVLFQEWKAFIDSELTVVLLSTSHHAVDLAYANKDLIGRISHVDVMMWEKEDLKQIAVKGFNFMGVVVDTKAIDTIAGESAGLPIITQAVCLKLLISNKILYQQEKARNTKIGIGTTYQALNGVAQEDYKSLEFTYQLFIRGPRSKARKFDTYRLLLATFGQDPLRFQLTREELDARLLTLPIDGNLRPPPGSVTSTLQALRGFQERLKLPLLEWDDNHKILYVLEPSFLFYLRWREPKKSPEMLKALLDELLASFRSKK